MKTWIAGAVGFLLGGLTVWSLGPGPTAISPKAPSIAHPESKQTKMAVPIPTVVSTQSGEKLSTVDSILLEASRSASPGKTKILLENALKTNPQDPRLCMAMGLLLSESFSDMTAAVPFFERVLAVDPSSHEALNQMSAIAVSAPEELTRTKALDYLRQVQQNNPSEPAPRVTLGEIEAAQGHTGAAIDWYQSAIQLPSGSENGHLRLGEIYLRAQNPKAVDHFGALLQRREQDLATARSTGEDVEVHQKALDSSRANYATSLIASGRLEDADPIVRGLVDTYPDNGTYQNMLHDLQARRNGERPAKGLPERPGLAQPSPEK